MIKRLISAFKSVTKKGFFHILAGNTLVKFIAFFSAMLIPRLLTKEDFGRLAYVDNIYSYILLINGLGIATAVLRFVSLANSEIEKKAVFNFGMKFGIAVDFIIILLLMPVLYFLPLPISGAKQYLYLIMFLPIFAFAFDVLTYYLRANFRNRQFSLLTVCYSLVSALSQILLAWKFNIFGAIFARYFATTLALILGFFFIFKAHREIRNEVFPLNKEYKHNLIKYSLAALAANAFSLIIPLNEQMVLSQIVKSEVQTANYRAAALGAQNIQFITMSVIVFIYPYFAKHSTDGKWLWKNFKKTTLALFVIIGGLTVIAVILTPFIVSLIFGSKYNDIIGLMSFMWVTFGINAALRMPVGNILAAIGQVKYNLIAAAISCAVHIALDIFLISRFGINGLAFAITTVYLLSGIAGVIYFRIFCKKLESSEQVKNEQN